MSDFVLPVTRYALSGEVNIAYQTMGDGPVDIILVPGLISHVEFLHEFLVIRPSCAVFRHSRVSSHSTREGKDCPIAYPALRRLNKGWMTFAPSWTTLI
jgi:hypothetical protein